MFNASDTYTSLGSNKLQACWTNLVTKFDTSSFYNWEQDNLPLYDLDERTSYLWERFGYPTSSINGVALVVSADANPATCNTNIFKTLSGCLNAIPEVINYPIVVEVASFSSLGTLQLSNKIFGPRGSIEIINRNYNKVDPLISFANTPFNVSFELYDSTRSDYLASSVSSEDFLGGWFDHIQRGFRDASAMSISAAVFSSITDSRRLNNLTLFTRKNQVSNNQRMTAALAARNSVTPWSGSSRLATFNAYENNSESWDQLTVYDASTVNEINNSIINWRDDVGIGAIASQVAYMNRLSAIKIYNCNGPIYIRGFTVDGGGLNGTEFGIDIRNSTVNLTDCSVARCTKAGLNAVNSKVNILRSFVAYRNYAFSTSGTRNDVSWTDKINGSQLQTSGLQSKAAGILAVNSEINFDQDFTKYFDAVKYGYGVFFGTQVESFPAFNSLICLSRNDIGISLVNSKLIGGQKEVSLFGATTFYGAQQIFVELNSEAGIKLDSSEIDYSGRILLYGNFRGIDSYNSKLLIDILVALYNQKEACRLENSKLRYNKELYKPQDLTDNSNLNFRANGTHLKLTNSVLEPTDTSSYASYYRNFVASGSFGITQNVADQKGILPSVIVDSNSKLRLVSPVIYNPSSFCEQEKPIFGAAISINNNSLATLQGTSSYATRIIGPDNYTYQYNKAGIYANNNSTVKIQGPSVLAKYGIDIFANNNSKIEITPPKKEDGSIDIYGFDLQAPNNHTSVELHATRACLVADNNSIISMKDLGSYIPLWSNGSYGSSILLSGMSYQVSSSKLNYAPYTSGGFLQFYPNPNDVSAYGTNKPGVQNPTGLTNNNFTRNATSPVSYNYYLNQYIGDKDNNQNLSSTTVGGMCVRALNGSKVNVDNVNFPCGWPNPSSVIYDYAAPDGVCSRLFIWNIADLSQLNARFVSVSGQHPADAAYFGPSGVWGNNGAPTGTPETGSVSILDFFGQSASAHIYSSVIATNQGPFRIYFSTDPVINWARPVSGPNIDGYLPQLYSQGYQFSSNIIFSGSVSSVHKTILSISNNALVASGYYYASSIMSNPTIVRVLLDDSALNAFANAKHNSVGKSGLAKVVQFYYPIIDKFGGDSIDSSLKTYGKGVKSVNTFDLEKIN